MARFEPGAGAKELTTIKFSPQLVIISIQFILIHQWLHSLPFW
jgi:hypothetical protein